ncbi:acyltransferase domain-containing protein, partial [Streptomyces olivaceoviridis]|uniref:acyltransferase domain-containing protein n=1 Tax=Streptomyces olivaceoviridis TaxID=1921 RepID=UPI0036F7A986
MLVAEGREQVLAGLTALAQDTPSGQLVTGRVTEGRVAFLFPGQGSQRVGMGRELYETFPAFAKALDAVLSGFDARLREAMWHDETALDQTEFTQAGLFAVEVALFRLLESWGVRPDFVTGHSLGELAAAHVAGVLSLQDAVRLVTARGQLMQALPAGGAMAAVEATEAEVLALTDTGVSIAAVNAPTSVVITGDDTAITAATARLTAMGRRTHRLRTSHAFHSPLMEPMLNHFRQLAEQLTYHQPQIPVVSNLTGEPVKEFTADHWVKHVRDTVRFADGIRWLHGQGVTRFVELGPDTVLTATARQSIDTPDTLTVPALRKDHPEPTALLTALAHLHVNGTRIDWDSYFTGTGARRTDLPTYAFQHQRYWLLEQPGSHSPTEMGLDEADHPLLGALVPLPGSDGVVFTGRITKATQQWLADHVVGGAVLLPGTAFVELAVRAGDQVGCGRIEELTLQAPLVLPETGGVQVQLTVDGADDSGRRNVTVFARDEAAAVDAPWTRHAVGVLARSAGGSGVDLAQWPPVGAEVVDLDGFYDEMAAVGLVYGPAFQGLRAAWRRGDEVFAEVSLPEESATEAGRFGLHPALLDAALHATALTGAVGEGTALPFSWSDVELYASGASALRVRMRSTGERAVALEIADCAGQPLASVGRLALREVDTGRLEARSPLHDSLFRVVWAEVPVSVPVAGVGAVAWEAVESGGVVPGVVTLRCGGGSDPQA